MPVTNASGRPVAQTITKEERVPYSATRITLSCGHVEPVNPFYKWYVGDKRDCAQCLDAWRAVTNGRCPKCQRGLYPRDTVKVCVNCNVTYA
jgi:hypothetical protein